MASDQLKKNPLSHLRLDSTVVAVTGGNGFFGHKLVQSLLDSGVKKVVSMDMRHTRDWSHAGSRLDLKTVDIRDSKAVTKSLEGVNVIVHAASFFGYPAFGSLGSGQDVYDINVNGTHNVIVAAQQNKISCLVYISSSSAILGDGELVWATEDAPYPSRYLDHYGPSKAKAEKLVLAANSDSLRTSVIRPSGIYGTEETLHVPRILNISRLAFNSLIFYFAGPPVTDWTHVENLIWSTYLIINSLHSDGLAANQIFHITDGVALSNIEFFRPPLEACGIYVKPIIPLFFFILFPLAIICELFCWYTWSLLHLSPFMTPLEAFKSCTTHTLSIDKAKRILGYDPIISQQEGLEQVAKFFGSKSRSKQSK